MESRLYAFGSMKVLLAMTLAEGSVEGQEQSAANPGEAISNPVSRVSRKKFLVIMVNGKSTPCSA